MFAERSFIVIDLCRFLGHFSEFCSVTYFFYFVDTMPVDYSGTPHDFVGRVGSLRIEIGRIGSLIDDRFAR